MTPVAKRLLGTLGILALLSTGLWLAGLYPLLAAAPLLLGIFLAVAPLVMLYFYQKGDR
jgi:hypothetical protein